MCGLIVSIRLLDSPNSQEEAKLHDAIITSLKEITAQRGPDAQNTYIGTFPLNADSAVEVSITASVLGLRGGGITAQPLIGKLGVLGWNGQVFQGLDVGSDNDTQKLFERLEDGEDVATVLAGIEGPYVLVSNSTPLLNEVIVTHSSTYMYVGSLIGNRSLTRCPVSFSNYTFPG